jgi:hypothetical protein
MFVTFMSTIQNRIILFHRSSYPWPSNFLQSSYSYFILIHCSCSVPCAYIPSCFPISLILLLCLGRFHSVWLFRGHDLDLLTVRFFYGEKLSHCHPTPNLKGQSTVFITRGQGRPALPPGTGYLFWSPFTTFRACIGTILFSGHHHTGKNGYHILHNGLLNCILIKNLHLNMITWW